MADSVSPLVQWYRSAVRRLLETVDPQRVERSDTECSRLETLEQSFSEDVPICFLGKAGVGKSTLVNALVNERLLPSGGIGPLTAQALSVRFGEPASFEVHYHKPGRVWRVAFALQRMHLADLRRQGRETAALAQKNLLGPLHDEGEGEAIAPAAPESEESTPPAATQGERNRELLRDAAIMIAGRQDVERGTDYLADRLCEALGRPALFETPCHPEDGSRVQALIEALALGKAEQPCICLEIDPGFRTLLADHASGFLAPIIKTLEVRWDAPLLRSGVVLVDLPGVGIAGDVLANVTAQFVREKAQVVVLTVDVRGLTQPDAHLLTSSGFLTRLLHAWDDPEADPVQLVMAVVRADEAAAARYADFRQQHPSDHTRKKRDFLSEVCAEAVQVRTAELRRFLTETWRDGGELSVAQQKVLDRLFNELIVHPVATTEYQKYLADDEDDRPFIRAADESNIPAFVASLESLAQRINARRRERLERTRSLFFSSLTTRLKLLREQWQQETRAEEDAARLREELGVVVKPKHEEFIACRAQYRAFLRETIPAEIEKLVLEASLMSRNSIDRYLATLSDAHWRTLRATVLRGGTFSGSTREIALPRELAQRFEDPVAEIWGNKLLRLIRKRTQTYAQTCVAMVREILDWARGQGARVKTSLLEAQYDQIEDDAKQLTTIGKDLIDELRTEVKNRLMDRIRGPIEKRCEQFVARNQHLGGGMRHRILELFHTLAGEVVEAAAAPAIDLLTGRFKTVEGEIIKVLRADENPITSAAETIVESHEMTTRRSDAQRRRGVLRQIEEIEATSPLPWTTETIRAEVLLLPDA